MTDSAELTRTKDMLRHLVSDPDGGIEGTRRVCDEVYRNFVPPADAVIEPVDAGGVPALWVSAPGASPESVAVLVHGGGYVMGTAHNYRELGYRISKAAGCRVLVVDYRLAPEHQYPAALDDVLAAYRWVRGQAGVRAVALVGDSAGGGLVTSAMVALRDQGEQGPETAVLMSPLTDLAGEGRSITERAHLDPLPVGGMVAAMGGAYLGDRDPKQTPLGSPLYADLHGMPPMLVMVGTHECLHDDSTRLVDKIRAAGGEVTFEVGEEMVHIWPVFDFLPEAQKATDRIGEFLAQRLS